MLRQLNLSWLLKRLEKMDEMALALHWMFQ
jgi:hypothetical protein